MRAPTSYPWGFGSHENIHQTWSIRQTKSVSSELDTTAGFGPTPWTVCWAAAVLLCYPQLHMSSWLPQGIIHRYSPQYHCRCFHLNIIEQSIPSHLFFPLVKILTLQKTTQSSNQQFLHQFYGSCEKGPIIDSNLAVFPIQDDHGWDGLGYVQLWIRPCPWDPAYLVYSLLLLATILWYSRPFSNDC